MKTKNLLLVLLAVCVFSACSKDEEGGALFKEPCTQWGARKSIVKSYMKGSVLVDDMDEDYMCFTDAGIHNFVPYVLTYDYEFDVEIVYDHVNMTSYEVNNGLEESAVFLVAPSKKQMKNLEDDFVSFFKEKYNEVPLSSLPGDYFEEDDDDVDEEILCAFVNDERTVYVVVGVVDELYTLAASYSCEF